MNNPSYTYYIISLTLLALATPSRSATDFVDVGVTGVIHYFIDASTLKYEAPYVRYTLVGEGKAGSSTYKYTGEIGANCALRTRIEYTSTARGATPEFRQVYEGTRQANEISTACSLVNASQLTPNAPSEPKPQPRAPVEIATPPVVISASPTPKSSGTGFSISNDGIIVTNHHVINECSSVRGLVNEILLDASVLAIDEQNDLAALKIKSQQIPALAIAASQPELGAIITLLGYPLTGVLGTDPKATTGIVSSLSGIKGDRKNMQISASVQPGNSGGPVFDDKGAVVGVVVAKLANRFSAENVNFAIRAPLLRSFLEINGIEYGLSKQTRTLTISEVVKKARPSLVLLFCY